MSDPLSAQIQAAMDAVARAEEQNPDAGKFLSWGPKTEVPRVLWFAGEYRTNPKGKAYPDVWTLTVVDSETGQAIRTEERTRSYRADDAETED